MLATDILHATSRVGKNRSNILKEFTGIDPDIDPYSRRQQIGAIIANYLGMSPIDS